jgi:hypothetical protein
MQVKRRQRSNLLLSYHSEGAFAATAAFETLRGVYPDGRSRVEGLRETRSENFLFIIETNNENQNPYYPSSAFLLHLLPNSAS